MALDKLTFGLSGAVPENAKAAWGARAIFHQGRAGRKASFDLVWDRLDIKALSPEDKELLIDRLDGGGLQAARQAFAKADLEPWESRVITLYEQKGCKIVANPKGSYGYVYLAAWIC